MDSHAGDALRRIQDIVAQATGQSLSADAQRQLEAVLGTIAGDGADRARDNFSERDVTILLADLRGFTAITATYPAGVVLEMLNRCFVEMSQIIVRHHGTIDKFMGDSIMVIFFGDPASPGADVRRALGCAVDMQLGMESINRRHRDSRLPELFMGIGINTGRVMAGLLGSDLYSAYTVIGEDVNLASRIEAFSLRGQILISDGTYGLCGDYAETGQPMEVFVKGRSSACGCASCSASRPSAGKCRGRKCAAARASRCACRSTTSCCRTRSCCRRRCRPRSSTSATTACSRKCRRRSRCMPT
jgi:adenylate cyclase